MKAVLYARVSSKEQEETGYSLPAQEKFLREYAERKAFDIEKVFAVSESASGKKLREVFKEMMAYVDKNKIKIVICEKVDRLTRNFSDAVEIDQWLDVDEERQIHLVKNALVLHKNSRSQERLNWGVHLLFAKNHIDNMKEEVKKGYNEKLRQGGYPGVPPIGYKTIGDKASVYTWWMKRNARTL
jgi:site-specific DNA recombinase